MILKRILLAGGVCLRHTCMPCVYLFYLMGHYDCVQVKFTLVLICSQYSPTALNICHIEVLYLIGDLTTFDLLILWRNVLLDKFPMDDCLDGRLSGWMIVRMDHCPDGRLS